MKAKVTVKDVRIDTAVIGEFTVDVEYSIEEMMFIRTEAPKFFDEIALAIEMLKKM